MTEDDIRMEALIITISDLLSKESESMEMDVLLNCVREAWKRRNLDRLRVVLAIVDILEGHSEIKMISPESKSIN